MARSQTKRKNLDRDEIKSWLDEVLNEFNSRSFLYSDPLGFVHQYQTDQDREFVALIAALFAYGNVSSILKTLQMLLKPLGDHPVESLKSLNDKDINRIWKKAYYRFYSSSDIIFLFRRVQKMIKENNSLQTAFLKSWDGNMLRSLLTFRSLFSDGATKTYGIKFMFAHPFEGTAKRWHMFLRWMVRKDEVDLGLWTQVPKANLIQPLDTHLFQIGRALQLTSRKTPGLKAALEMTQKFREWDPEDPIKYDFALCRLGVLREKHKRLNELLG